MVKNLIRQKEVTKEFNEFKDALFKKKVLRHTMRRIQSKKHKLGTCEINRKLSPCFDDKRSVSNDGIHTWAYSQKELRK